MLLVAFLAAAVSIITRPALAEFEIQEPTVEKGEVELEYRGAVHWGFPEDASGAEQGALAEEAEAEFLRQSHDLETRIRADGALVIRHDLVGRRTARRGLQCQFR